jgi:hypothetical protein
METAIQQQNASNLLCVESCEKPCTDTKHGFTYFLPQQQQSLSCNHRVIQSQAQETQM